MRVYRRRKPSDDFSNDGGERFPDIVYQMGAEAAAQHVAQMRREQSFYAGGQPMEEQFVYEVPYVSSGIDESYADDIQYKELDNDNRRSSPLHFIGAALGLGRRSKSRNRERRNSTERFGRRGSPDRFAERPLSSPVHFGDRPHSPVMSRSRRSSPYHFGTKERVESPYHFMPPERTPSTHQFISEPRSHPADVARRVQRAQLSQHLQQVEQQQRFQQDMMLENSTAYPPQYPFGQQSFYPFNAYPHAQNYHSMMPQVPMYPYY